MIRFPPSSVLCSFVVPCSVGFSASPHLKYSLCIAVLLQGCYLSISLSQLFVCNLVLLFIKCFDLSCNYIIYLNPALCFLWVHWLFAADLASSQTKLTSSASSALRPEHQGSPCAQTANSVNILVAIRWVVKAWVAVKETTICKSFEKLVYWTLL